MTGTWLPPQSVKQRVLKFRLGTYIPPPPDKGLISQSFSQTNRQSDRQSGIHTANEYLSQSVGKTINHTEGQRVSRQLVRQSKQLEHQ